MAEKNDIIIKEKGSKSNLIKPIIIGGCVVVVAGFSFYIIKKIIDAAGKTEERKYEIMQDYLEELKERDEYWANIIENGEITEDQQAYIDAKTDALAQKERLLDSLDHNAWIEFVHQLAVLGVALGVTYLVALAGTVAAQWFQQRLRKWSLAGQQKPPLIGGGGGGSPVTPKPICPIDGIGFSNIESFQHHWINSHNLSYDNASIAAAQNQFNSMGYVAKQSVHAQAMVVMGTQGSYAPPTNWLQIGSIALQAIMIGVLLVSGLGAPAAGVGGASAVGGLMSTANAGRAGVLGLGFTSPGTWGTVMGRGFLQKAISLTSREAAVAASVSQNGMRIPVFA